MATMLGSLLVSLGLESAKFTKGLTKAQWEMKRTQQRFDKIGTKMASVGKAFSVGITAPVLGVAAAFGKSAHDMAMNAREISTAAQVAGEGFEDFQRQAFAAKSVGIEFDKLGDIFKDVRDRVGDFTATGGGPMADFFENIAPKVGITADAFKNLSGKESLQLYYDSLKAANVSQDEMVFYLEAMASDTTALIPLLEKGGKAFKELGENTTVITEEKRQQLEKYVKAQERLTKATEALTIAFVSSGLLDTVVSLVQRFAAFAENLSQTNPQLLQVGAIVAGVAAVVGPFVIVIGNLVSAFGVLLPVLKGVPAVFAAIKVASLALMANPVIFAFAGVIAGITAVWYYWDDIKPVIERLGAAVVAWYDSSIKPTFDKVMAVLEPFISFFVDYFAGQFRDAVRLISALVSGDFAGAWEAAKAIVGRAVTALGGFVVSLAQVGADLIAGLVRGILDNAQAVLSAITGTVRRGVDAAKELLGIRSPSRVFMGIGANIAEGMAIGIMNGKPGVEAAAAELANAAKGAAQGVDRAGSLIDDAAGSMAEDTEVQTVRIARSFGDMAQSVVGTLRDLYSAIKGGGFFDILSGVIGAVVSFGQSGAFGVDFQKVMDSVPKFATGTNFAPGGMALVGEMGPELVNLPRGSQVVPNRELRAAGAGRFQVEVVANNDGFGAFVRDQAGRVVAQSMPTIARAGSRQAQADRSEAALRQVRR